MDYSRLLEGKSVIVSSGARGMGWAISELFARHGARVAICGMNPAGATSGEKLNEISEGSFFFQCDMGSREQVYAFCDEALKRFGVVDVIVNNVGINNTEMSHEITQEKYDRIHNVNIRACINMLYKLAPAMMKQRSGAIVNISTIHSVATTYKFGSYAASKGGMNAFSRATAVDLGLFNIRSNTVCPGGVATTTFEKRVKSMTKEEILSMVPKNVVGMQGGQPTYGPGYAEDIANASLFCASDLSAYVTGATFMVDGGASNQAHSVEFDMPESYSEDVRNYILGQTYIQEILNKD